VFLLGLFLAVARAWSGDPVLLTNQHVDLRITHDASLETPLGLRVVDGDAQPARVFASTNCILVAAESSRLELPADVPPLGSAGDSLWALPASQEPGLLYLGTSAEGIPGGTFSGAMNLRLLRVEGPGHFFLWQAELGALQFWMNSRDGVDASDAFAQLPGGHSHANWGFTTSGVYRITFQAEGRRVGESTNRVSEPTVFTFHVLPLPAVPPSPFATWQALHWPGVSDAATIGETADPDADGRPNLWEYADGTDPRVADVPVVPQLVASVSAAGAESKLVLRMRRPTTATDLEVRVFTATDPSGPWQPLTGATPVESSEGEWTRVEVVDPLGIALTSGRFYRVGLLRKGNP
jgi:surface-anchored protein